MNPGPIDISSDEEEELGRADDPEDEGYDWVSELLDSVEFANDDDFGDANNDNYSDDVVVIGEVNTNPKAVSSKPTVVDVDDDCVVLDGDPDKPVSVVEDPGSGSDELLVVGEKGQIACRDYPHPRHLCAKFPFKTTLHVKHCGLCHCYVCDSLAPCVHWGTGGSNNDHCHATDNEEMWKILRKNFKIGKSAPLPALKLSVALPTLGPVPPLNFIPLAPSSISQNHVSRPTITRVPSVRNPVRSHHSEFPLSKNRTRPASVLKQSVGARNNVIGRNRVHSIGDLGPQFVSSHPVFKRVGDVGGSLPKNQTAFGSSNSTCTGPSQYSRNSTPVTASGDRKHLRWQNVPSTVHQNSSQPMGTLFGNTVPNQPQTYNTMGSTFDSVYSQNFPQPGIHSPNDSQNISEYGNQSQDASQGVYQYEYQNENSSQNICLLGNLGASVTDVGFSDCNYGWVDSYSQGIQQPPFQQPPIQRPPVEISQIQSTEPICGPSLVKEQSDGIANLNGLDKQFESWLMENQPVPAVTIDSLSSHLNMSSPEPTFMDTGMLMFDFETSRNGLTQV